MYGRKRLRAKSFAGEYRLRTYIARHLVRPDGTYQKQILSAGSSAISYPLDAEGVRGSEAYSQIPHGIGESGRSGVGMGLVGGR